jgi:hypothetical protein
MNRGLIYFFSLATGIFFTHLLLIISHVLFPQLGIKGLDYGFSFFLALLLLVLIIPLHKLYNRFHSAFFLWFSPLIIGGVVSTVLGLLLISTGLGAFFSFQPFVFGVSMISTILFILTLKMEVKFNGIANWKGDVVLISFPIVLVIIYLAAFPLILPSVAYRFMPEQIQARIYNEALLDARVGDPIEKLSNAVPGRFKTENGYLRSSGNQDGLTYCLIVKNDIVVFVDAQPN